MYGQVYDAYNHSTYDIGQGVYVDNFGTPVSKETAPPTEQKKDNTIFFVVSGLLIVLLIFVISQNDRK